MGPFYRWPTGSDMTDRAISRMCEQQALMARKPFFIYFAPGATHAPHQVPTEWLDRYRGQDHLITPGDRIRGAMTRR